MFQLWHHQFRSCLRDHEVLLVDNFGIEDSRLKNNYKERIMRFVDDLIDDL